MANGREAGPDRLLAALGDVARAASRTVSDAPSWDSARRRELLAALDRTMAALTAARSDLLLAERDSGAWRGTGDPSFAAWRGRAARTGRGAAIAEERRAQALAAMPDMRAATVAGEVSVAHVDVVGKVAAQASARVREALGTPEGHAHVLELAQRLDATRFGRALDTWAAALDAGHLERTHQAQRAGRYLHVVDAGDGTRIHGRLDRMAGHRLRLALEAASPRPGPDDERTPEQRRADALETLADKVLSLPGTTTGAAVRPHVSFLMTEETWAALRGARTAVDDAGDDAGTGLSDDAADDAANPPSWAAGCATTLPTALPVTLEDGTPVPVSEVARALCDCELTRIVVGADGEPLDLGRTARTYTGAQRRAVIARDRRCAWPECDTPARWCEVHHLRWWDRDDGETSVENGVLLCSFHHHEIHRRDLTLLRRPADPVEVAATGRRVTYVLTTSDGRRATGGSTDPPRDAGRPGRPGWTPRDGSAGTRAGSPEPDELRLAV